MKLKHILILILFFLFTLSANIVGLFTDYLWFYEVGYHNVFFTVLKTRIMLGAIAFALFFAFMYINIRAALKNTSGLKFLLIYSGVILIISLLFGLYAASKWDIVLRYLNQVPFNLNDPIFGHDISFYVFSLPFYNFLLNSLFLVVILSGIGAAVIYLINGGILDQLESQTDPRYQKVINVIRLPEGTKIHFAVIAGLFTLLLTIKFYLMRFDILYTPKKAFFGPGYADINLQLYVITLMAVLALLISVLFFLSIKNTNVKWPLVGIILIIIIFTGGSFLTTMVHQYKVLPDEYNIEKPYIENNIKYTRLAFDLEDIEQIEFPASDNLALNDIEENTKTIENIRLWDWRPMLTTYKQLQLIRTYYEFKDIDINRLTIDGEYMQIAVSAREIDSKRLPEQARTWVNEHLVFTHGYGIAMSPVRGVSKEGLPQFYIKDVPPRSEFFNITRPEIYFGELDDGYVIVGTTNPEFDYPSGELNVYTNYKGTGGISLRSGLVKLAMAVRFGEINILISDSIQPESRILFNRNINNRIRTIAPFLKYDNDPYIALSEGKLYWIIDGYTVTDRFPYSEPAGGINYIRNPVKAVIDAYNGSVELYLLNGSNDPIIETYSAMFPDLFKPISLMPEGLKSQIRYPEDMFRVQAAKYALYHMKDPGVFYNREDVWEIPEELYEGSKIEMEPYYLITKLPGLQDEEFILLLPFTPRSKTNMIAWMGARNDMPNYGKRIVYVFPKEKLVYGPMQIEARIDQNTEISQSFTLWSQSGSRVIRGNLLVIPVEDSLLYVEPIYLRAEQRDSIPELKRVIVVYGDKITMQETLDEAIAVIFKGKVPERTIIPVEDTGTNDELIQQVVEYYERAQQLLKEGDLEGFGREINRMGKILEKLKK
ncbi:hypothetical protein ANME2D_03089 [Candidatus Methanoperedens nitroreducens]|uniref:UPF0182 protein ANME2D_03089 n=1 Tax=Candidatus Methanoperedens nitratireducens TaxID=1392998 RepID=A0A062V5J1_9EURY|nr:UPF0182 family protein [Candidatus Methanoperedens nitroreducens]KCZ71059.1 hypothetical protein ANME2D_03089 [Candidatus Methanoperedens nitroreducens]MDJ1421567.1 UPF0182 family protein [Candidatus Methanoperedens sp.]